MSKKKKSRPEILHPEVERQLPVKPVVVPSMEELNRLMEHMLAHERRRARREFAGIVAAIGLIFLLILAGGAWFTHGVLRQLQEERQLSEKSREDLLALVYSGRRPESAEAGMGAAPAVPAPPAAVPAPSARATPAPAGLAEMPVPASSTAAAAPAVTPAPPPRPAPASFRKSLEVQAAGGLTLRLPIPPPPS